MLVILGFAVVIFSVFGGYAMAGGHLMALFEPIELLMIGGAATGAFIVANDGRTIKLALKALGGTFLPNRYKKAFNVELLLMFFELNSKIRKDGVLAIEGDIQDYKSSELFSKYKKVQGDKKIMEFICDNMQLIVTGRVSVHELENIIDEDIECYEIESEGPLNAVNKVADGLPAFGIVAAVMGVIHTMESINQPPEILGAYIAKALVGTFLGVLIAYGFVAPMAASIETKRTATLKTLFAIKVLLISAASNLPPSIAVEVARKVLYSDQRPKAVELEAIIKDAKAVK